MRAGGALARRGAAEVAVARRRLRQILVGSAVWSLVFGGSAASSALNYASTYPTASQRQEIAATTGHDTGFAVLLGPVADIGTVGGYMVYKGFVFLTVIGAIWGLFAATRLLRGEEDSGRWQLLLSGASRPSRVTAATLAALAAGVAILFAGSVLCVLLAGRDRSLGFDAEGVLVYGLSLVVAPAVFAAVGAVTSQLAGTRRMATGLGMGVFGVAFVLRMVADSGPNTHGLLWLTPFGWVELMRPFTANDLLPLALAGAAVAVLAAVATVLAARRDAGGGLLGSRDTAPLRRFGLRSPLGLTTRLELPGLAAWCLGAAAAGLAFGSVSAAIVGTLPDSFGDALNRFAVRGTLLDQFLSIVFMFLGTIVALIPAGQMGAAAEEETSGRLTHVLVRPPGRASLLAGRMALTAAAVIVAALLAGFAVWAGACLRGVDVGLLPLVGAGLNTAPTALLALGIGAMTLAVAPRAAATVVYAVVIGSLIIDLLGALLPGTAWLVNLSLFHYMAAAPARDPDPARVLTVLTSGGALCVLAAYLYRRRDLASA